MINYTAIAQADSNLEPPFLDPAEAAEAIRSLTVDTYPEKLMSYISIANELSAETANELEKVINTAIAAGAIGAWYGERMNGKGIDVNNPQVRGTDEKPSMLLALTQIPETTFTPVMVQSILDAGVVKVPDPSLAGTRAGHVITAREIRDGTFERKGEVFTPQQRLEGE